MGPVEASSAIVEYPAKRAAATARAPRVERIENLLWIDGVILLPSGLSCGIMEPRPARYVHGMRETR
jgi:hypothetical protein